MYESNGNWDKNPCDGNWGFFWSGAKGNLYFAERSSDGHWQAENLGRDWKDFKVTAVESWWEWC